MRPVSGMCLLSGSLGFLVAIAACADPTSVAVPAEATWLGITASPGSPASIEVGDTVRVQTAMRPQHVSWEVRDATVLRQLKGETFVAIGAGATYVVATGTHPHNRATQDSSFVSVTVASPSELPLAEPTSTTTEPTTGPEPTGPEPTPGPEPTTGPEPTGPEPTTTETSDAPETTDGSDTTDTSDTSVPAPSASTGIWISASEIAALPTSGGAWTNVKAAADRDCGTPNLSDQSQDNNVCIMAKALVAARTGHAAHLDAVVAAIRSIVQSGTYNGRALALGRELAAYVISADLIGLKAHDAALDQQFRAKLVELRTTPTTDGPKTLVECHERRPNNWGTMCGASRAAIAAYLGDRAELDRTAQVFRGYLGDRSAYASFVYGSDLSWQCDSTKPVGINPKGCVKNGVSLDGILPDDQRRGGSFSWPPPKENYVYEGLQGALTQALLLSRQGYDSWNWSDRALLRAFTWLHQQAGFAAEGDDTWQPHVMNGVYGTSFPAPVPARAGKIVGWTDWTFRTAN